MGYKLLTECSRLCRSTRPGSKDAVKRESRGANENAMGSMFVNGADLAFIVGSDCPELNSDYLRMMIHKSSRAGFAVGTG